jgi:hypothetical protein
MIAPNQQHEPDIHQGDWWAWAVSFLVTLALHVGIVVFTTLSIALAIYALASGFTDVSSGVRIIAWFFTILSLILWGRLIKQQTQGFRPHVIRGLGRSTVATTGCDWGEIAGDIGAALIGIAQIAPLSISLIVQNWVPDLTRVLTALVGGVFLTLGCGSLIARLLLRRRRLGTARPVRKT